MVRAASFFPPLCNAPNTPLIKRRATWDSTNLKDRYARAGDVTSRAAAKQLRGLTMTQELRLRAVDLSNLHCNHGFSLFSAVSESCPRHAQPEQVGHAITTWQRKNLFLKLELDARSTAS